MSQPVQQAYHDPEIIYIVNSQAFQEWYQYYSQYFTFGSVYEAAVAFALEAFPDVVEQLTSGLPPCTFSQFDTPPFLYRIIKRGPSIHYRSL